MACAGVKAAPDTAVNAVRTNLQDKYKHKYTVTFANGDKYSFSDQEIDVQANSIGIRFDNEERYRYYSPDKFQQIKIRRKTHWLTGAGIGAGVGGVAGGVGMYFGGKCTGGSESDSDCDGLRTMGTVLMSIVGVAVGFGIGAGIGAAIPKSKNKVNVTASPTVYHDDKNHISGGGIGISGSF
ncbi:MAG: hypothetical protein ABIG43_07170 [Chloroflexota bacterium]